MSGECLKNLDRVHQKTILRSRILRCSTALFLEKGFEGTTVREIADSAGILNGSLYHMFTNKEGILHGVLEELMHDLFLWTDSRFSFEERPLERLCAPLCALAYMSYHHPPLAGIISIGYKTYTIYSNLVDILNKWTYHNICSENRIYPEVHIVNLYAFAGALGNIMESFEKEPGMLDLTITMHFLIRLYFNLCEIPMEGVDSAIHNVYDVMQKEGLTIPTFT